MRGPKHFLSLKDFTQKDIAILIKDAIAIKKNPKHYANAAKQKTLLMVFETSSVRTRLSFETGMTQMGGHAIAYSTAESTLGKKESIEDFSRTASRYVDIITARLSSHEMLEKMADVSSVPVINALTRQEHPCQIASDLMTIQEKFKKLKGLKLAFVGDCNNNIPVSLIFGCLTMGMDISVACPEEADVPKDAKHVGDMLSMRYKGKFEIKRDENDAVKDADVVYADTWMSYFTATKDDEELTRLFMPYQVNKHLMEKAKSRALFMHDLPATRGKEVTDEVMDSKQSIVFDQAENRLHMQKAIILRLLKK
ncbi:MAG TPA: ornithine carbamoyltransferase [archaeon]|nr:ornithine carbamoyltransferase [archaeon]